MKVLCPVDFSPASERVTDLAVRIARGLDAELVLAHVSRPFAGFDDPPFSAELVREVADRNAGALAALVQQLTRDGASAPRARSLTGSPWREIVATVEDDPAIALVVLGAHGLRGLRRALLGSVAERVVRHAACSVLVARGETTGFANVLFAIDFSASSRDAVDGLVELARHAPISVTLLHVVDAPIVYSGERTIAAMTADLEARCARMLERDAIELRARLPAGSTVATRARIGSPAVETLAALDADPTVDLVVVGSHGRTGAGRIVLGSVAETIVRHAGCSVLVARHRQ